MLLTAIIKEMEGFLKNHPNAKKLMDFLQQKIKARQTLITQNETGVDFYKIKFSCSLNKRCPFSLWIERSSDEIIFFNIGQSDHDAVVLHYWDISTQNSLDDALVIIHRVLNSNILVTQVYCNRRLKKIYYKASKDQYTCLVENTFLCFRKNKIVYQYEPWF